MKRKESPTKQKPQAKRPRPAVPEYHLTPSIQEADGKVQWPAPLADIERAREIIIECAEAKQPTLIVPDKDADGLSSGAILRHTLMLLGLPAELLHVHLLKKGTTVNSDAETERMSSLNPSYVFVLDHGSRPSPALVPQAKRTFIIDHHHATPTDFPEGSEHVTACDSPPVATSSLLTWHICEPLHPDFRARCDWLCIVGTHGDLGNTLKWEAPFPDMREPLKKYTKKALNDVVSLVNAPRRTATYDVKSAWDALCETEEPASVLKNIRLLKARQEVNDEVERCTHAAPKFSPDGKIAVFRIRSEAQVHPVIATRWAGHLQSKALEIVMVANEGYLPGMVNFSCRIPRCARARETPVDIIKSLKAYASLTEPPPLPWESEAQRASSSQDAPTPKTPLIERLGTDFARGHVQASGGIVTAEHFEELMQLMQIGIKAPPKETDSTSPAAKKKKGPLDPGQKNTLTSYFSKSTKAAAIGAT